ncbi:hypothetical protein LSTR_LSTR000021 [Laodelphax striatellus]|uniref:Uncharacterized protein n=1 Tax=Laodelphax striatellus TaxID=195883 RepID=A0A482X6B4_LAOST|nr:hypothetical protein LSTR_LSTR000021 [Laodelphax striatellus]
MSNDNKNLMKIRKGNLQHRNFKIPPEVPVPEKAEQKPRKFSIIKEILEVDMAITIPGFVVVVFVVWYSMGVWKSTDRYFRDEYKNHLKKEYEKNKYLKEEEINKLISERKGSDQTVEQDKTKSENEITNVQLEDKPVTNNYPYEPIGIGNKYDDKKVEDTRIASEDWEDDNTPRSHDNVCYADKDELCKLFIAQKSTEETSQNDYTDEEYCSMQSGSEEFCLP